MNETWMIAGLSRDELTLYIGAGVLVLVVLIFVLPRVLAGLRRGEESEREEGMGTVVTPRAILPAAPVVSEQRPSGEGSVGAWVLTTPQVSRNRIWYQVPEGENWVTTFFGKAFRVLGPGLNATLPYLEIVGARVPTRIFRIDLAAVDLNARSSSEAREPDVIIRIDTVCFAQIVDPKVVAYDLEIRRDPDDQRLVSVSAVRDFIRETIVARLRKFTATRTFDELMVIRESDLRELVQDIQQVLRSFGIRVSKFQISQPIPDQELLAARAQVAITRERTEAGLLEAEREKRMAELRAQGLAAGITATFRAIRAAISEGLPESAISALLEGIVAQFALSEERGSNQAQPILILGGGGSKSEAHSAATLGVLATKMEEIEKTLAARAGSGLTESEVREILRSELAGLLPPSQQEEVA